MWNRHTRCDNVVTMKSLGERYEERAVTLIEEQGLCLVERNFRGKTGEIDIIARDGTQLVFMEVRSRSNRFFHSAAGSVDVQRAIAAVLIRADYQAIAKPEVARVLSQNRLRSPDGADIIDILIRRLQAP